MKKIKYSNMLIFALFLFFSVFTTVNADCILGEQTTKDVQGVLNIFRIVAPLLVLGLTVVDGIKAITADDKMPSNKLVQRFVKRLVAVALLFILPTLINLIFDITGIYTSDKCDLDGTGGSASGASTAPADPYGCYQVSGIGNGYVWGKASEYNGKGTKVNNDLCGRNQYGGKYECYECNSNSSIHKWQASSSADGECGGGYHVLSNRTKDNC